MPESYRKPRARRNPEVEVPDTFLTILEAQHACGRDPQAWAALRQRAIRFYVQQKGLTPEVAANMYDALARKPHYLPCLPPKQCATPSAD
jgi:hypothetical protein